MVKNGVDWDQVENPEFVCMRETISDTQKKIREWVSCGYKIHIAAQSSIDANTLITSIWLQKC